MQARQAQQDASLALSAAAAAASTQSATATAQARADILNLYVALYRAAPTLANLNSWTDKRVNQNQTLGQIADNMLAGGTPKTNYPTSLSNADFVTRIYSYGLNRVPDNEGLNYWSGQLASGALTRGGVASAILSAASAYGGSDPVAVDARRYLVNTVAGYAGAVLGSAASEVSNTSATLSAVQPAWNAASSANSYSSSIKTQVAQLWLTVSGQNASVASMNTWGQQLAGGSTPITVASAMLATGSSLYTGLGNGAFVDRLYLTTQNRLPDAGGRAYWQARLDGGESRGSVTWNFIAAVSGYNGTDPAGLAGRDSFNGKVSASLSAFSSEVGSAQSAYDSALAAYNAALAVQNALQAVFNCASKAVSAIDAQNSASTSAATAAAAALARDNAIAAAQGYATPGAPVSSDARLEIGRIYALLYNRAPSATELNNWVLQRALKPAAQIVSDMLAGDLASGLGAMTNTNFVKSLYANALNRANPASADINYWTAQISSYGRGQMAMNLLGATAGYNGTDSQGLASAVFFNNRVAAYMDAFVGDPRTAQDAANAALAAAQKKIGTAFYPTQGSATRLVETTQNGLHHLWVTQLIGALLGRAPSVAEARAWVARFASLPAGGNPGPFATVAQEMLADPTLGAQYAASGSAGSATNSAFFSKLYNLALGRSAVASDPGFAADVNWWVGNTAGRTRGQALELFLNTVLDYANGNVLGLAAQAYCNHNALSGLLTTASVAATQKIARDAAVSAAARQLDVALDVKAALDGMAADSLFATGLQGVRENPPGAIVQYGATPQIWQTVDRWGNVLSVTDERNSAWVTRHAWDASDRLIGSIEADGSTTASYYDAAGRVIATQDGRGGVTRLRYDGNGNLVQETHADGGIVAYRVDGFGQVVQQRDAAGVLTVYDYDRLGRRISSARGLGPGVQSWHLVNATGAGAAAVADDSAPLPETVTYNALGQRIRVTNSAGETQRFGYDVRGNLVSAIDGLGRQTRYGHSALGVKISEQRGNGSNGESSSWNVDAFGRVQSVTVSVINDGLSQSHQTVYSYNRLGLVTRQTNAARGQDLAFGYDHASGLLVEIADRAQAATAGIVRLTRYAYDAAGNRIREKTSAVDASGLETDIAQDNHIGYDRRGRVSEIADGRYHVRHVYDANGNRVEVLTDYLREKNAARPQDGDERISLHAYNAFDAMNRQTIVDGISDGAQGAMISHIGNQVVGQEIVYDSAGKRLMVRQWGKRIVDMGGSYRVVDDYSSETYGYDGAGRLTDIYRDGLNAEARLYDKAGRVVQQGPGENSGAALAALAAAGVDVSRQFNSYDAAGDLIFQTVKNSDGSLGHIVDNNFRDELGRLRKYNLDRYGQGGYHSEYVYRYAGFDADQVEAISVHRNGESATTTNVFDANGHTVAVEATNSPGSARSLVTDAQGKVLRRTQDGHVYTSLIVNGELIGSASDGAALVPDSFLSNYVPVTDAALSGAPTGYVVQAGDTLQGIARALWGNASLWYVIADANALGTQTLNAGDVLRIPVRPNTVYAGADTFRPYDAARAIGAITPVIAAPGEQSCGLAQVFVMAVTAVVSAYTAGLLSGVGGTLLETVQAGLGVAAGGGTGIAGAGFAGVAGSALGVGGTLAVSAAVGSVAGQLTGMALGVQQKFDWRSVAFSALSAGVAPELERFGAGVGGALASATDSRWLGVAAQAALGNVATQGLSIVTGQQPGFSWRKVVASALGATVGEALKDKLGSGFGGRLSGRLAVGMTAALARGGRVAAGAVIADAFGNALGNSIAETDWSGTARQAVSTSAQEQAQDFAREEMRFVRKAAASRDDNQLDLTGGDFARMDRALGHAADAVWAVAGRAGQDVPYPSDINGLDLPAGYPIDVPDPLSEDEGDRLLRRMRDAAIERAAAQREAAMRAANEASVAGLNNRDNPATYRSASAGYQAARYLRDMANFVPDDFPAPRATRYTREDGLADPNYRLAESALRSEGAADAKYMAMARERNARVEKYNQSLRRPWADYIAPGKYAMEFYNLYGVGIEWTVGENGNLDEIKFSIGLGVSRHFSRTDLPAPQALRGGAATYKNELYPGLATQPAIQGEARLGVSATGSLSFLSFSADLPGVAVGLSSRTRSMFYGQFEPAAWAVDPLKALRPSSWMPEVSGRVALEGSYRFKQPKPLEPMPLVRPK